MSPNALLLLPWLAALGGWATVSVKDLPDYIVAGQATHLSFLVRQHGANRLNGLHPTIEARNGALAATVDAKSIGDGTYAGELTLTQPGDWTITINSGFGNSRVTLLPIRVVAAAGRMPVALTEVERGERLFTAMGCTTCHVQYDVGPKLAGRTFDPDYLGKWLADPQAVRANARMPRQDLTPADISALTAFLSQSAQRS